MIKITGQHYINGQWTNSTNETFSSYNPCTDKENPWQFFTASTNDINNAVSTAAQAFTQYRNTTTEQRAQLLDNIAVEIERLGEQLITTVMNETALPQLRVEGERGRTCSQLRLFANNLRQSICPVYIDKAMPERQPLPRADSRLTQIPLGPVVVFGASNFPLAFSTAGGDTASALAAGCPVIVKGHPAHPATSELVCHAIDRAIKQSDMPRGIFTLVQANTSQAAQQLVNAPLIKAVGFTGSQHVGDILNSIAQSRPVPIPFYGELGSTNPQFILPKLLSNQPVALAQNQVNSMLMGHGQFCTSPGLVVVEESPALDIFVSEIATGIAAANPGTMLTKGIASAYQKKLTEYSNHPNLTLIAQGQTGEGHCQTPAAIFSIAATDFLSQPVLHEELFGPCALIVKCQSKVEFEQVAQSLPGQLTASIHGTEAEISDALSLIHEVAQHVGRLIFNQLPTGVEVCHSMQHGGPYPASTAPQTTSVGSQAITRFTRPICLQNMPQDILPNELKDGAATLQIIN
ncbi:aldehyde dehydrogenase (NADP(+)) [Psychrobium sp. 1_MG-2023]|uniref:aldehyde dehydrogenase (NADP(+)) n=1 Tax=Psychrobium sp. 1_MG-2023 TaxID=3062624 RepID=UPI000C31C675|nr:aldehyde dehydrogenase (NADP(+)) [Psychrobium sp. 1_MG-2023]MDP2562498.1 aldehyde dehydrogenase (NADP(+)) [Psychrobium sp. 1_MG-2023]PKF54331.1 aldehyde dehydrogenase (NADP(+)) [Alteromonadales bacterium alter-6D02]